MRHDGRQPDELRPITSSATSPSRPPARCSCSFGAHPGAVHRVDRRGRAALDAGARARAGSPPSTRCCPARRPSGSGARSQGGSRRAAPRRSSASSAGRCAPSATCGARRAPGDRRLRRAAGRRRHPHGVDLRRLRRAARRAHPPRAGRASSRPIRSPTHCAAISVGIVGGVPVLDLALRRGLARAEVDMNVVMTGAGRFVEVQGTAEGMPFSPAASSTPCSRWPRAGIGEIVDLQRRAAGRPPPAPRPCRTEHAGWPPARVVLATANPGKVAEIAALLSACRRARAAPGRRARRRRGRRHARGQRPAQGRRRSRRRPGGRAWPTTPGSRSTRSAARRGSTRPAIAGEDGDLRRDNVAKLLAELAGVADRGAHRTVPHGRWCCSRPTARARRRRGGRGHRSPRRPGRRRLRLRPGVRARRRRRPHVRRDVAEGQVGDQPPRPSAASVGRVDLPAVLTPSGIR